MVKKIRIMIAEDQSIYRDALRRGLENERVTIIGEAENGKILLELIEAVLPDIVLLDLRMPVLDGEETLKIITRDFPSVKTIILSYDKYGYDVANTILNGARAYLNKESSMDEVMQAIEGVYADGFYFNKLVSRDILDLLRSSKKIYYLLGNEKLSAREIEVLQLICKDIPPEKIADKLNISTTTVRYHKNNLLKKTESDTIISLVKYAIKHRIVKV